MADYTLPTYRVSFDKQLIILRAYGAASDDPTAPVTNQEVASITKLTPQSVSIVNGFLADSGFLIRADGNGYFPAEEVKEYARSFSWEGEKAYLKLQPIVKKTWFAEVVIKQLRFTPMNIEEAIQLLGSTADADPDQRPQLEALLGYLEITGVIKNDGGKLSLPHETRSGTAHLKVGAAILNAPPEMPYVDGGQSYQTSKASPSNSVGGIQLQFNVDVNMAEMGKWSPDRIAAFMSGIAKVLTAKAGLPGEQEVTNK